MDKTNPERVMLVTLNAGLFLAAVSLFIGSNSTAMKSAALILMVMTTATLFDMRRTWKIEDQ